MKRVLFGSAMVAFALGLAGCPIYPNDDGCVIDSDCTDGFSCDYSSGSCVRADEANVCHAPSDCYPNYTCAADNHCSPGSCRFHGCVTGYSCENDTGRWACVPSGTTPDSGTLPIDAGRVDASSNPDGSAKAAFDASEDAQTGTAPDATSDASAPARDAQSDVVADASPPAEQ
jgi:hypothetical protein